MGGKYEFGYVEKAYQDSHMTKMEVIKRKEPSYASTSSPLNMENISSSIAANFGPSFVWV